MYGAVFTVDNRGKYHVDAEKTEQARQAIRKERLQRGRPTREWMTEERGRIERKEASLPVRHMYATSFEITEKFLTEFREFWNLPETWNLREDELEMPTFGSGHKKSHVR